MMKRTLKNISSYVLGIIGLGAIVTSCSTDPNSPGYEYMPDMYRSPAIEAYVDYGLVGDNEIDSLKEQLSARRPPKGTVPYIADPVTAKMYLSYNRKPSAGADKTHGFFNVERDSANGISYELAVGDKNPIAYSPEVLEEGKVLYERFCDHCHGENGDGQGKIVQRGALSGIPSYKDKLKDLPEGQVFYSITFGKGLMGAHASQINIEERWKIVHYIKALQNGGEYPVAVADSTITVEVAPSPIADVQTETHE